MEQLTSKIAFAVVLKGRIKLWKYDWIRGYAGSS